MRNPLLHRPPATMEATVPMAIPNSAPATLAMRRVRRVTRLAKAEGTPVRGTAPGATMEATVPMATPDSAPATLAMRRVRRATRLAKAEGTPARGTSAAATLKTTPPMATATDVTTTIANNGDRPHSTTEKLYTSRAK